MKTMRRTDRHKKVLCGQKKPSIEQTAWVFSHLKDHMKDTGSFRVLIYGRMGYDANAYISLFEAGGMDLSNAFIDLDEFEKKTKEKS